MIRAIIPIVALLMSVALLLMANGLLGVLLPLRALMQGFDALDVGLMGTAYFGGFLIGCLLGPRLVLRVGHIRTFAALAAIVCSLTLVHGLSEIKWVWWLARATSGLCFATLYIVIESWLNGEASNENRGLVFSIYTIVNLTVITIGQLALTLAGVEEFVLFALAAILVSLSIVPVSASAAVPPAALTTTHLRLGYLFRRSHVAILGSLGVGLANGSFWTLAPVFVQSSTPDGNVVAYFMGLTVISGALGQWPLGRLSDHMDRRRVIAWASVGATFGGIMLGSAVLSGSFLIYIGAFMFGTFAFPLYALCAANLNDSIEPGGYVEAASGVLMAYALGAVIGPLVASALMNLFGARTLFVFTACVHVSVAIYAQYRLRHHKPELATAHGSFTDALVMTSISADIDPRSQTDDH